MAKKVKRTRGAKSLGRRWNRSQIVLAALTLAVVSMAFAFALYTQSLNIDGSVKADAMKWSVHFVPDSYQESPGSVSADVYQLTATTAAYTIKLKWPDDFYEFSANIINDGTFDATLRSLTITTPAAMQTNLRHEINYAGSIFATSQNDLSLKLPHTLGQNAKTVKIRVSFNAPADIPDGGTTLNLSTSLHFEHGN